MKPPHSKSTSSSVARTAATLASLLIAVSAPSQTTLPQPSYANSVHLLFDARGLSGTDAEFNADADAILSLPHGPYARLGTYIYSMVDMPWAHDPATPVLYAPSEAALVAILDRLRSRGLEFHVVLDVGMSRGTWVYDAAFAEDRRNAQWYGDGAILKYAASMPGWNAVFATPSRYARKLRRHMESKTRETARLLVSLRRAYPETFLSASGDGEAELNFGGLDTTLPYEVQAITDYSPFAILEFRDWIQHAGLYADGAGFSGQGFPEGGVAYQGEVGLAAFNAAYGTSFTSWSLRYFDWSLTEPVNADPRAIPAAVYGGAGWSPLPSSGAVFIAGGFDAPRAWSVPSAAFHALWLRFRVAMLHNYVNDFSDWITTTPDLEGTTFEAERWFTHQIPADYLGGTYPGCSLPDRRLLTSASTLDVAIPRSGRMGLTVFDVFDGEGTIATSVHLVPEIQRRGIPSWGLMEYSPSWPAGGNDPDIAGIVNRIHAAVDAGAHVINFHTWPHFFSTVYTSNADAFSKFLRDTRYQPRDSATMLYAPPPVSTLEGRHVKDGVELTWGTDLRLPDGTRFRWGNWPDFSHFEVWAGPTPDFDATQGRPLGNTASTFFSAPSLQASDRYFRVRAVSRREVPGGFSSSWTGGFYILSPCRVLDTREATGPAAGAPGLSSFASRVLQLATRCGIPVAASAVSANVTVIQPGADGALRAVPGDEDLSPAQAVLFRAGRTVANNAILSLASSGAGTVRIANDSPGRVDVVIDVNGYFQ